MTSTIPSTGPSNTCGEASTISGVEPHARVEYGKVLRRDRQYRKAVAVLGEALAELTKSGDERCSVRTLSALGTTLVESGDVVSGQEMLMEALRRGRHIGERHTVRGALAGLAWARADSGRPLDAVTILGFVDGLGRSIGVPPTEIATERRQSRLAELRSVVGADEFDRMYESGHRLDMDEAISLALGEPLRVPLRG